MNMNAYVSFGVFKVELRERASQTGERERISTLCKNVASGNITITDYHLIKRFHEELLREVIQLQQENNSS
jgi:hypothetical protein